MFESNELRVKPVKRYRVPRYPSHTDPDPTLHPQPVPYPAGRQFLATVAAVGIATTAACDRAVNETGSVQQPPGESPFRVAISGLPHRTSAYGTGMPSYMDADLARRVIECTFRKAGYSLAHKQRYDRDGAAFVVDGYDAAKKVGYVFADWHNLDDDAFEHWWARSAESVNSIAKGEIDSLQQTLQFEPDAKGLLAEIETAHQLPDPARREAAYSAILAKRSRDLVSLKEMEYLEQRAPRDKEFIAVISQYDRRFLSDYWATTLSEDLDALNKIPDPAKREAANRALQEKVGRNAIERLENSVREYIDWARSQGAQ